MANAPHIPQRQPGRRRRAVARALGAGVALLVAAAADGAPAQLAIHTPTRDVTGSKTRAASARTRDTVTLRARARDFPALYAPPAGQAASARGAAVLLPRGTALAGALRRALSRDGWASLSIALPPPTPPGADPADFVRAADARIGAAITYLREHGLSNVVLIGYDLGASLGAQYLALHAGKPVRAFVDIDTVDGLVGPKLAVGHGLPDVRVPVLDIKAGAGRAKASASASAPHLQLHLPGAHRHAHANDRALLSRVRRWLRQYAAGSPSQGPIKTAQQQ